MTDLQNEIKITVCTNGPTCSGKIRKIESDDEVQRYLCRYHEKVWRDERSI